MPSEIIDNQADFENAFLNGNVSNDIRLAPGSYTVPVPSDEDKIYTYKGTITGCGDESGDVVLNGKIGVASYLTLKNLTFNNTSAHDGLIAFHDTSLNLQKVKLTQKDAEDRFLVRCDEGAKLTVDDIIINCNPWGNIDCKDYVQVAISDSKLQGLCLEGDNGSAVLRNSSLGKLFIKGKWSIMLDDVVLYDHPTTGKYIHFNEGYVAKHNEVAGRKWLMYTQDATIFAHNLRIPDKLASQVAPFGASGGQLFGNIIDDKQRIYQPLVDVSNGAKVQLKGTNTAPLLHDATPHSHDAVKELQQLIGLKNVKKQVEEFIQMALMNKRREKAGMSTISNSFHSLFEGNPGTGKTTVARIVGKLMYEEGILPTSNYVEVDRGDLVAGYVGQTSPKTTKILEKATGGVLFIDEAYDLVHGSDDSFGREALDTIMKYMEDHRDNLMIIFAGYTADMEKLLKQNSGMKSRVPNVFTFDDYSPEEIVEIGHLQLQNKQMHFDRPDTEALYNRLIQERYANSNDHSNGRWIRNQNDVLLRQIAVAMAKDPNHPLDKVMAEDIINAFNKAGDSNRPTGASDDQEAKQNDQSNMPPLPPVNNNPLPFLNGDELK
ncbi:MAG: AAA family ATPase [Limosilactobacillus sp.]